MRGVFFLLVVHFLQTSTHATRSPTQHQGSPQPIACIDRVYRQERKETRQRALRLRLGGSYVFYSVCVESRSHPRGQQRPLRPRPLHHRPTTSAICARNPCSGSGVRSLTPSDRTPSRSPRGLGRSREKRATRSPLTLSHWVYQQVLPHSTRADARHQGFA